MAVLAALPQRPHDLDGLLEHLQAHVGRRPAVAEDVLVERLAAADAEGEAALEHTALVAAACAITAGWMRTVGQVTPVVTGRTDVACASAPITDHTNALWPCWSFHGW